MFVALLHISFKPEVFDAGLGVVLKFVLKLELGPEIRTYILNFVHIS